MPRNGWIVVLAIGAASCGKSGATNHPPTGPTCTPVAATETTCSGGVDDDCDGYVDCLDTDCDGQPCGDGLTCSGGACRAALPARRLLRPRAAVNPERARHHPRRHGDSSSSSRWPARSTIASTRSRIAADWLIGANGEVGVKNGIYRCAGDRVFQDREADTPTCSTARSPVATTPATTTSARRTRRSSATST